jgi:hypothetical protein
LLNVRPTGVILGLVGVPALFKVTTVNGSGQLVAFQDVTCVQFCDGLTGLEIGQGTASIRDTGSNGLISWGRWTGGEITFSNGSSLPLTGNLESLHYVFTASQTPDSFFTQSTNTTPLTYNFVGGTSATSASGSGTGVTGGTLTLNLLGTSATLAANFNVNYASTNYNVQGSTTGITSANFTMSGSAAGGGCGSGCATSINGVFAGAQAQSAGLTYGFVDNTAQIKGAAVFAQ